MLALFVLDLLSDNSGRSTHIILKGDSILADMGTLLSVVVSGRDKVDAAHFERSKPCLLHTSGAGLDGLATFCLESDFLGLATAQSEDLFGAKVELAEGHVRGFEGAGGEGPGMAGVRVLSVVVEGTALDLGL